MFVAVQGSKRETGGATGFDGGGEFIVAAALPRGDPSWFLRLMRIYVSQFRLLLQYAETSDFI